MTRPNQDNSLDNRFTYHPPKGEWQAELYQEIRDSAKSFAQYLQDTCPESRELSLALTNLEQTVFWANAAIARHG